MGKELLSKIIMFIKKYANSINLILIVCLAITLYINNTSLYKEVKVLNMKIYELQDESNMQANLLNEMVIADQLRLEESLKINYNDIHGGIYCCGWDFYTYDETKDITLINPIGVPISITVKGKIPNYISFTKEDRDYFTFFYKNGDEYYPIWSYIVISKASVQYGWLSTNKIEPELDLGNGYIVYEVEANVPSNEYTDDTAIIQKMKDFMKLVSFKVVK